MKRAILLIAMTLLLAACEQKSEAPAGTSKQATTTAAGTTASAMTGTAVASADDIPSETDFEEEAAKEITADNLDAELDTLDKEIGQ